MQTDNKQAKSKLAMSRALGAAFLSHQVEELEKSVGKVSPGATSNNWRERNGLLVGAGDGKRGGAQQHPHQAGRKRERKDGERMAGREIRDQLDSRGRKQAGRDADMVIVDASVLVHALGQVKKWCKDGRQEEIVIPLEALNTLDLLKKGSAPLAQRARAASRILEAQVGTNPRIRVQRDDAFVLWDEVPFKASSSPSAEIPLLLNVNAGSGSGPPRPGNTTAGLAPPPEWLRRTICCGIWEIVHAVADPTCSNIRASSSTLSHPPVLSLTRSSTPTSSVTASRHPTSQLEAGEDLRDPNPDSNLKKRVVLAVSVNAASGATPNSLEQSPVHAGRYERADGSLVRTWAQRAGIEVLDVDPSVVPSATPLPRNHGPSSPEKRRGHPSGGPEKRDRRDSKDDTLEREKKPPLVEKPIAMTIVNDQPVKLLRVLARGEKLDP